MKCRGVYENPAGTLLFALHRDLEGICMDRELLASATCWPCPIPTPYTTATGSRPSAKPCRPFSTSRRRRSPAPCAPSSTRRRVAPGPYLSLLALLRGIWPRSKAATTTTRTRRLHPPQRPAPGHVRGHQKQDGEIEHSNFEMQRVSKVIQSSPVPARPQGPAPASARAGLFHNGSAE